MTKEAQIKEALRSITGKKSHVLLSGVVQKVGHTTCDVEIPGGLVLEDVRLKPSTADSDFIVLRPKPGSIVKMIPESDDLERMLVVCIDSLLSLEVKSEKFHLLVDLEDNKVTISNEKKDFMSLVSELISATKKIKVSTSTGPSGVPLPDSQNALDQVETSFKKLFK